jgi:hypothetical protein
MTLTLTPTDSQKVWDHIRKHTEKGWIVGAGTKHDAVSKGCGLVYGHCYSVVDTCVVDGGTYRLVCMRNTWGGKEWNGRWSDNSPLWTPDRKHQVMSQTLNPNLKS